MLLCFLDTETQILPESERERACSRRVLSKWKLAFLLGFYITRNRGSNAGGLAHPRLLHPQVLLAPPSADPEAKCLSDHLCRRSGPSQPASSPPESRMSPTASTRLLSICLWLPRNHFHKRPKGSYTSESARGSLLLARAISRVSLTQSDVLIKALMCWPLALLTLLHSDCPGHSWTNRQITPPSQALVHGQFPPRRFTQRPWLPNLRGWHAHLPQTFQSAFLSEILPQSPCRCF